MVRAVTNACIQDQPERSPTLYAPGILEPARHDPHHGVALSVEGQGPADERRVRSEATLPKPVAQHDGPLRTGVVLVREEGAPDRSLSAKIGEQARRVYHRRQTIQHGSARPVAGTVAY